PTTATSASAPGSSVQEALGEAPARIIRGDCGARGADPWQSGVAPAHLAGQRVGRARPPALAPRPARLPGLPGAARARRAGPLPALPGRAALARRGHLPALRPAPTVRRVPRAAGGVHARVGADGPRRRGAGARPRAEVPR